MKRSSDKEAARASSSHHRARQKVQVALGLAIAYATCPPGIARSGAEIAAYCGCTQQNIDLIEKRALDKVRKGLQLRGITVDDLRHLSQFRTANSKRRSI